MTGELVEKHEISSLLDLDMFFVGIKKRSLHGVRVTKLTFAQKNAFFGENAFFGTQSVEVHDIAIYSFDQIINYIKSMLVNGTVENARIEIEYNYGVVCPSDEALSSVI